MKTQFTQEQISQTAVRLGIPDVPFTHRRIARAFDLVATNKVNEVSHDDGFYRVHSQYDDKIYTVEVNHLPVRTQTGGNPHCTCPDNERTIFCKHSIASLMYAKQAQEQKASKLILYINPINNERNQWAVDEGDDYYIVRRPQHGKWTCTCGKPDCKHCKAIRENLPKPKMVNECGSIEVKALQDKLNGDNGTGDNNPVHHQLDLSNPFEECEQRDIDQIEGRSNGNLVHHLKNGEYVISYRGIMKLAEQHSITFEAARHDETRTVIAQGRCGNNSRASGKPINGSEVTAIELAKRNAARMLLPVPEQKALVHKFKLESEFNWQVAKRKCLELVPDFTFDILINDLIKAGTLRQAHSSDYSRKEWLLIFDACKRDAETNGHDDDDGAGNTASSPDKFTECRDAAKDFVRFNWLKSDMLKEGVVSGDWTDDDFAKLKSECEIDRSLFGRKLGTYRIEKEFNANRPWIYQRRYTFHLISMKARRQCFHCGNTEGVLRDRRVRWERYEFKTSLCQTACDPTNEELTQKFDDLYHGNGCPNTVITSENVYGGRKVKFEIDTNKPNWVTIHYDNGTYSTTHSETIYESVLGSA